jgi:hypothetical protein
MFSPIKSGKIRDSCRKVPSIYHSAPIDQGTPPGRSFARIAGWSALTGSVLLLATWLVNLLA